MRDLRIGRPRAGQAGRLRLRSRQSEGSLAWAVLGIWERLSPESLPAKGSHLSEPGPKAGQALPCCDDRRTDKIRPRAWDEERYLAPSGNPNPYGPLRSALAPCAVMASMVAPGWSMNTLQPEQRRRELLRHG